MSACKTCGGLGEDTARQRTDGSNPPCLDCGGSGDTRAALEADPLLSVLADFFAGKGTMYVSDIRKKMPAIRASLANAGLLVTDEQAAVIAAAEAWHDAPDPYIKAIYGGDLYDAVGAWRAAKGGES